MRLSGPDNDGDAVTLVLVVLVKLVEYNIEGDRLGLGVDDNVGLDESLGDKLVEVVSVCDGVGLVLVVTEAVADADALAVADRVSEAVDDEE